MNGEPTVDRRGRRDDAEDSTFGDVEELFFFACVQPASNRFATLPCIHRDVSCSFVLAADHRSRQAEEAFLKEERPQKMGSKLRMP
ncbi:hypothetical protein PFLUV_G00053920 [Perca fluviatilis]|uniref:Uncharacterized protein n=1 Tax=Perca fluviatilis TaxID=8168 RepID=A0A6A5FCC3_PERFL|nr:hypothetical protein PFLUV_G00053920 [Perca fluviatilis]